MPERNIYVLNTLSTGLELLSLLHRSIPIQGVIGLSQRSAGDSISGYLYMAPWCKEHGIRFIEVDDYRLRSDDDRKRIEGLDIDVLVVCGWQRLVPEYLIRQCREAALGIHGSAYGITRGRGRSPQNWALILGEKEFEIAVFCLDSGADSGPVLGQRTFPIEAEDDIRAMYRKSMLASGELLLQALTDHRPLKEQAERQTGEPAYLPQRRPEDGAIDWEQPAEQVVRFIRALSRPYPGAWSRLPEEKGIIKIFRARTFACNLPDRVVPGEVCHVFADGAALVATGRGAVLVEEYELPDDAVELLPGLRLLSVRFEDQLREIIRRHRSAYPELPVAPALLAAAAIDQ